MDEHFRREELEGQDILLLERQESLSRQEPDQIELLEFPFSIRPHDEIHHDAPGQPSADGDSKIEYRESDLYGSADQTIRKRISCHQASGIGLAGSGQR